MNGPSAEEVVDYGTTGCNVLSTLVHRVPQERRQEVYEFKQAFRMANWNCSAFAGYVPSTEK